MIESEFLQIFAEAAKHVSDGDLEIRTKSNLLYELYLDKNLKVSPVNINIPKRGNSAFQTDFCVYEKSNDILLPRVVIEFKKKVTTHDIITYSSKAGKHKAIYPSLRYGLLSSEISRIPNRFFIHNENLDFFIAALKYKEDMLLRFVKDLIDKEVKISKKLDQINFQNNSFDYFRSEIILENFIN